MLSDKLEADVDRLLADRTPEVQAATRALRAVVQREVPDADEQVDFPDKLISYGWSIKMRDLLFAIIPHQAYVNLQLADGAELPDPTGIVEGTGKRIRHVKIRSVEQANSEPVRNLMRAQLERRPKG